MNRPRRTLLVFLIILAGALFASALTVWFTPNSSWLAFAGWTVFFLSLQLPWLFAPPETQAACTVWLARLRKRTS